MLKQEPYYKGTTATQNDATTIQNNTATNMSEDEQRPVATFEEAFRDDVQPRPGLEATLMTPHPELQVEAERVRRARQEEEQADSRMGLHMRVVEMVMWLFGFWMKQSQRQGATILFKILVNSTISKAL
jgi:hypothetical protein